MKRETNRLVAWFFWFGWFTDKLEAWLEAKAAQGWHLVKADRGLLRFHFERGPKKQVRVCIDYQPTATSEYGTIFADCGWELASEGGVRSSIGWYIWRMEYTGTRPEIFNDLDSLIQRNHRLLLVVLAGFVCQIPAWIAVDFGRISLPVALSGPLLAIYIVAMAVLVFSLIAIPITNARLKARRL